MIDLAAAIDLVERTAAPLPPRRPPLLDACGAVLGAPIIADCDSPPWDRAMMDGFAVQSADFAPGADETVELEVIVDLAAGDVSGVTVRPGTCARIMTGAPIPTGADAVVPIERAVDGTASAHAGGRVRLRDGRFRSGQHVARRGAAFRRGQEVLPGGSRLAAAEIGLAAEAGAVNVMAVPRPRVAILSTGSELVAPEVVPGHGQTRNSNAPMLAAASTLLGAEPLPLGSVPDRPDVIREAVLRGLDADLLVLSGGVSAGDLDLVPDTFAQCGVERVFHKVRLKPGKPVWFGILRRAGAQPPTLVFGLPGNPASSLVCFELFVRPALRILAGRSRAEWHLPRSRAVLTAPAQAAEDRPVFLPARLGRAAATVESTGLRAPPLPRATPLPWTGSSDLLGLAGASCLVALPAGSGVHAAGTEVEVVLRD
jgi:molybdopterin molybdotransferase